MLLVFLVFPVGRELVTCFTLCLSALVCFRFYFKSENAVSPDWREGGKGDGAGGCWLGEKVELKKNSTVVDKRIITKYFMGNRLPNKAD